MTEIERVNEAYPERYANWAGNPQGQKPNFDCCCESVYDNTTRRSHQCQKKRGHGPGGAYCGTHNPDAVKARRDAHNAAYREKSNRERLQWSGARFYAALEEIANGRNDAREFAAQVIADFKAGEA